MGDNLLDFGTASVLAHQVTFVMWSVISLWEKSRAIRSAPCVCRCVLIL